MRDISLIYYTCNQVNDSFAQRIREQLFRCTEGEIPIISVSHKPIDFGENICVDGLQPSIYNVYRQILMGAKVAKTKYVATVEDDCLYTLAHFNCRPSDDSFIYNKSRWRVYSDFYLYKNRRDPTAPGMWNCISPTELMVNTLEDRFKKYPVQGSQIGWGEPGRYERKLGLPLVKAHSFSTDTPNLTFAHRGSLGGVRRIGPKDITQPELPYWGSAKELWEKMWNGD